MPGIRAIFYRFAPRDAFYIQISEYKFGNRDIWPYYLPFTIDYPEMDIWEMLESPSRLYGNKNALVYYGNRIKYRELWQNVKRDKNGIYVSGAKAHTTQSIAAL